MKACTVYICWKVTFWTCYLDHHPRPSSKNQKRVPKNLHDVSENGVLPKEIRVKMMMNQWMLCFFTQKLWDMSRESQHRPGCGDPPVALHLQDASQAVPGPSMFLHGYQTVYWCLLEIKLFPIISIDLLKNSYCWWKLNMICHQEVAKKDSSF